MKWPQEFSQASSFAPPNPLGRSPPPVSVRWAGSDKHLRNLWAEAAEVDFMLMVHLHRHAHLLTFSFALHKWHIAGISVTQHNSVPVRTG